MSSSGQKQPTCHCVFIFFLFPTWFFHLIEVYGPGGGTYFSIPRDFQNSITGIRVFVGHLGLIKR